MKEDQAVLKCPHHSTIELQHRTANATRARVAKGNKKVNSKVLSNSEVAKPILQQQEHILFLTNQRVCLHKIISQLYASILPLFFHKAILKLSYCGKVTTHNFGPSKKAFTKKDDF